ncbi:WW domain-binding protein 11 [Sarcoptes scabiei]|uniref:WW domain-binding protein 11 n=2 Tax=Sarcoptes scabiei TaxID=52283 RepID=A0A834R8Q4_SARSC|nr:WW domain-binding protein 11 [Sarcoptes scabiei]
MPRKMRASKSGRYINPTDKARKEARKRELKKNKKQRLIVRLAVLKGKDPYQIIADLERLDRMEYDFENPPSLNEKILKDKRRKLRETWDRICRHYNKEDKEKYSELKRLESQYESKRYELVKKYEAIKSAQEVNIDDIPLPSAQPSSDQTSSASVSTSNPTSILKTSKILQKRQPPGCPSGLPPNISELIGNIEISSDDDDDEDSNEQNSSDNKTKKIRFADEKNVDSQDGTSIQQFLEEIEQLSASKTVEENKNNATAQNKLESTENEVSASAVTSSPQPNIPPPLPILRNQPPIGLLGVPRIPPPPLSSVRQPILGPPPPIRKPPGMISSLPSMPTGSLIFSSQSNRPHLLNSFNQLLNQNKKQHGTTIEARPQLRNLSADATKFTPLALRVKREDKQSTSSLASRKPTKIIKSSIYGMVASHETIPSAIPSSSSLDRDQKPKSKDDAYEQFMKEMNELI